MPRLSKQEAKAEPIYQSVVISVALALVRNDRVSQREIMDGIELYKDEVPVGLTICPRVSTPGLRWDWVREFVEERLDRSLIPVSEAYFKRHSRAAEKGNEGTYITAAGEGATAGYVLASLATEHLVRKDTEYSVRRTVAALKRAFDRAEEANKTIPGFTSKLDLPDIPKAPGPATPEIPGYRQLKTAFGG